MSRQVTVNHTDTIIPHGDHEDVIHDVKRVSVPLTRAHNTHVNILPESIEHEHHSAHITTNTRTEMGTKLVEEKVQVPYEYMEAVEVPTTTTHYVRRTGTREESRTREVPHERTIVERVVVPPVITTVHHPVVQRAPVVRTVTKDVHITGIRGHYM